MNFNLYNKKYKYLHKFKSRHSLFFSSSHLDQLIICICIFFFKKKSPPRCGQVWHVGGADLNITGCWVSVLVAESITSVGSPFVLGRIKIPSFGWEDLYVQSILLNTCTSCASIEWCFLSNQSLKYTFKEAACTRNFGTTWYHPIIFHIIYKASLIII